MAKVRLSGSAKAYLRKEAYYLRQRSPQAAATFLACMAEARTNLKQFPLMGFQKAGLPIPNTRSLVVDTYVIDYETSGDELFITAIRPGQVPESLIEAEPDFDYEAGDKDHTSPGSKRR